MTEVKAAAHKIAVTVDTLPNRTKRIDSVYPGIFKGNPRGAGEMGLEAFDDAARALYVGEPSTAARFFTVGIECISAGARAAAAGIGVEIDFEIDAKPYRGSAKQPSSLLRPGEYIRALTFAIVLRIPKVADELMGVPIEEIEKAAGGMDPAFVRYVAAWRSFWQNAPDVTDLLEEAKVLFDPAQLEVSDPKAAARYSANIPVMQALLNNYEAGCNAGLAGALKAHKAWWGRGTRLKSPEGLLANQPAALASIALQRGMTVSTTSDYMPRWLIEGREPE